MQIFRGQVLLKELSVKAKVSTSLFHQLKDLEIYKMGQLSVVKISQLPKKYQTAAYKCHEMTTWWTYAYFSECIGLYKDYLSSLEFHKGMSFESMNIGHNKFFKLNDEFIKAIEKGDVPFLIRDEDDEKLAEYEVKIQGLRIGFY